MTPEQAAEEYANIQYGDRAKFTSVRSGDTWENGRQDFLAGHAAGVSYREQWVPVSEVDSLPKQDCVNLAVLLNGVEESIATYFIPDKNEGTDHRFFISYRKHFDNVTDQVTHFKILPPIPERITPPKTKE